MQRLRFLGMALLALFAIGALATNAASAEKGFLPREKPNFTLTAKNFRFEDTASFGVLCKTLTGKSEFTTDKHATMTLGLSGCTSGGLNTNSLGDTSGNILVPVLLLLCIVAPTKSLFGLAIETENSTLHVEIPSLGSLFDLAGRIIAHVLTVGPALKFTTDLTGSKGAGNIEECVDGAEAKKWTLTSEINHNGMAVLTSVKTEESFVTFTEEAQELMGS
jgi:hypothetical protein